MNAYISNDLNMVKELDPQRHELALQMEAYLGKGGTIEVLQGPSFKPPPVRYEPPPRKKSPIKAKVVKEPDPDKVDKLTVRDLEREERRVIAATARAELVKRVKSFAETMSYAEAIEHTGLTRKMLYTMAKDHGFSFQPASYRGEGSNNRGVIDEAHDTKIAERIKAFKEIGLSRNQAMGQCRITFKTLVRILAKFDIDYPKRIAGPHPAFFPKHKEATK